MELVLTKNIKPGSGPVNIEAYESGGGYSAFRIALGSEPAGLVKTVLDSKIKGRGGAGFPTGIKWGAMPPLDGSAHPRVIACNFDEMEPGTFKDRILVEGDPHQLIEGMLIAGWACQADIGYIFIRGEYKRASEILEKALAEARARGFLGKNILGNGWDYDIHLHASAGRYICGEETGLLNALEGKRANPRSKPPFPMVSGAWGKPTIVQNVETLCCLPHIIERGAEWFISLGKAKDSGTKIYGLSGNVNNPGAWELPMGTTLRELLEKAGGMREGYKFRAALPGGASTKFLIEDQLDVPLDFESLKALGLYLGTGTAIVLDDQTSIVAMSRNLQMFYARESCGWCTPCREGLPWIEKILYAMTNGEGQPGDVELLLDQAKFIGPHTYCALAAGAMFPLESAIALFREDFDLAESASQKV